MMLLDLVPAETLSEPKFVQVKSHCLEVFQRELHQ